MGTMFARGVFVAMCTISLKLVGAFALLLWTGSLLTGMTGATAMEDLAVMAMQQGGIGLLLTLLLVSVPPIAAAFFQGALGAVNPYSVFAGGASAPRPGEQGYRGAGSPPPPNAQSGAGRAQVDNAPPPQYGPQPYGLGAGGASEVGNRTLPQSGRRAANNSE